MNRPKPLMLIILDDWGIDSHKKGNAIHTALRPKLEKLINLYPSCRLQCSREAVGLPKGIMGNAEKMLDEKGPVHTAHTLNPVPFVLVDDSRRNVTLRNGAMADITPTILELITIDKPKAMTGASLLKAQA